MDRLQIAFYLIIILCLGPASLLSQEGFSTAGSNALGTGGGMSYTVGLAVYTDFSSPAGRVTSGVQQSYLAIMVSGEDPQPTVTVGLYPNPVQTIAHLNFDGQSSGIYNGRNTYRLVDLYGKTLLLGEMTGDITQVIVEGLAEGIYVLEVNISGSFFKTFKVIKTN